MNPMQTMTEAEVAGVLKVTVAAVRKWRRLGTGPRFTRVGRLIRYRWSAVEDWLDRHTPAVPGVPGLLLEPEASAVVKPNGGAKEDRQKPLT